MPIGKVWIYRLLFVCVFCVFVTDFSAADNASGVKICTAVHRRPGQGITNFGELCSPGSPKSDESASAGKHQRIAADDVKDTLEVRRAASGGRIGMCGYPSVPFTDGSSVLVKNSADDFQCSIIVCVHYSWVNCSSLSRAASDRGTH